MARKKLAVVLLNLGGPDSLEAVRPFLYNLFSDPAIIHLPTPLRQLVAKLISSRRESKAQEIYKKIGGKSPLLENTLAQATELKLVLEKSLPHWESDVFVAMRYWHPLTNETIKMVDDFGPDHVILLPLYPQFSTTTTGSSVGEWKKQAGKKPYTLSVVGCYSEDPGFVSAQTELVQVALGKVPANQQIRLLFSAHGLPQKIVDQGDPYQWQVEKTVQAVLKKLGDSLDSVVCYQSRVGPLKWLTPSLDEEINRAAQDKKGVIVVPISFTSEHSETLVELDMDFRQRAHELNIPYYDRVPTVSIHLEFIKGLANLVANTLQNGSPLRGRCLDQFSQCYCRSNKKDQVFWNETQRPNSSPCPQLKTTHTNRTYRN